VETPEFSAPLVEAVAVKVLSARDAGLVQIHDCNWKAVAGDYWVMGGSHGSGKSDLLATVAGLQRPGGGSLRLFGEDVAGMAESALLAKRLRIGFVFKSGGRMFADLTVAENIALPLRYHRTMAPGQIDETVRALAELTGLAESAGSRTREIGFNWHCRVGLARALALKPEILFLDEPIAGLESRHRRWWLDFLARLSAGTAGTGGGGVTIVVATNDLDPWLEQGRQFALIRDRCCHMLGSGTEIKDAEALLVESERLPVPKPQP
jgi:phospholipid/cholesterol/gamma-HCH transport system ATP-binding protein